jgi:hypothetical protein
MICIILIIIIDIILCTLLAYGFIHIHQVNTSVDEENKTLQNTNKLLKEKNAILIASNDKLWNEQDNLMKNFKNIKSTSEEAVENYSETLDLAYDKIKKEYDNKIAKLENEYDIFKDSILEAKEIEQKELDSIRATRAAAIQAQIKEKEIKENLNFYCLSVSASDRNDIQVLERIKTQLNKPRILSMLIWSTYFQKPMTSLCNNVLGTSTITGIYKITNQINGMCYIGQSVNVATRWKDHAKCGLGIDTPAGNKLYKAMIEEGIWNFSWELLEQCPKEKLNEKERYYIELYDAYNYGYNSNTGNR